MSHPAAIDWYRLTADQAAAELTRESGAEGFDELPKRAVDLNSTARTKSWSGAGGAAGRSSSGSSRAS